MPALRQHGWKADAIGQDDAADRVATFKGHKGAMWHVDSYVIGAFAEAVG